jgi:hypothetical protein
MSPIYDSPHDFWELLSNWSEGTVNFRGEAEFEEKCPVWDDRRYGNGMECIEVPIAEICSSNCVTETDRR